MYKVYIKIDTQGNIVAVNSDVFLPDPIPEGWVQIDEGIGDKYHHAQNNDFDEPLITDGGKCRYRYDNGEISESDISPTLEELKALKTAQIAAARYEEECAGITIQGVEIATDRDSQGLILGAVVQAQTTPDYIVQWKTKSGFVTLTAEQIIAIATAVRAHVQACFDREAYYLTQIEAATTPEMLQAVTFSME